MNVKTYPPNTEIPANIIFPEQTHSNNILEIITGQEDLENCDGIWTKNRELILGIKTADCAPICFWDDEKFGIIHAGWRGLQSGIVEKMCTVFNPQSSHIWVGPLLPEFEIQRDECYKLLSKKFDQFFFYPLSWGGGQGEGGLIFNFKAAIQHLLPTAQFDGRSTYDNLELASWRRDQDHQRNITIIKT